MNGLTNLLVKPQQERKIVVRHLPEERIFLHYAMTKETETERGKHSTVRPTPKKSVLDSAPNRISRTIA
jgi:hypothetical protein